MALKCYWVVAKRRLDCGRERRPCGLRSDALLKDLEIAMFGEILCTKKFGP
jgi:hypothetical protein